MMFSRGRTSEVSHESTELSVTAASTVLKDEATNSDATRAMTKRRVEEDLVMMGIYVMFFF